MTSHLSERDGEEGLGGIREVRPEPIGVAAVAIKPIQWDYSQGHLPDQEVWNTGEPWIYWIVKNGSGPYVWCENLGFADMVPASPVRGSFDTLDEAKAAAQADYEARIRSALENPPVALADATKNARELAEAREENERLRGALEPFAKIADIFDHVAGNRPREGDIMSWVDHRVGERVLTVEALRDARSALENGPAGLADATPKSPLEDTRLLRERVRELDLDVAGTWKAILHVFGPEGCSKVGEFFPEGRKYVEDLRARGGE